MALVLILFVLIIAMGCGALVCRLIIADNGQARYVETKSSQSRALVLVAGPGESLSVGPEQAKGQLIYFTKHAPEGYAKIGEPAGIPAP